MPPRKSDASRRSDVSNARFIVMDEEPPASTTPAKAAAAPAAAAGTPSSASAAKPSSSTPSIVPAPTPHSAAGAARPTPVTTEKKESQTHDKLAKADRDALTIEDLSLPKSIITRLAKGVLPPQTQIQGNAVLAMGKSATVFINYLASHANEITQNAGKKTVSAEDVFKALDDIEFGFLREPLEQEFAKYTQIQNAKRINYRNKVAAKKGASAAGAEGTASADASLLSNPDDSVMTAASSDTAPRTKKARVDESAMPVDEEADDAETEPEEDAEEDEDEDEEAEEDEEEEEEDDDDEEEGGSSEEVQDALETKEGEGSEVDEALDGDESD
ncbi:DNA polymerase epsilon subunit D [Colletotrichum orchidophilum]|uniref:DNA polymerase epsilon subunit D n=1 Tax=Colletotrichum orchidophilum TaxID=1209926 RepID=A0A1G4BI54_9PEZI|nr:DNA polymerase epsilon subunit D [Colletotrichum orchidophilum]OHF01055.1 DNA polymerase epsilon subunit D [Colletotrichum orchidophilum]